MTTYELMVVAKPDFDGTDSKKSTDVVTKLLGESGKVSTVTSLGKKQLAYPMGKFSEAWYILATVSGNSIKVADLEKRMKLEGGDIIRFLLTVKPAAAKA